MFGFDIKVKYIAKVKVYKVRYWAMQEESVIRFDRDYTLGEFFFTSGGNKSVVFTNPKWILDLIEEQVKSGAVWFDKDTCIAGTFKVKIIEIKDTEISKEVTERRYLSKWKKYIDEPYVIELK